MATKAVSDYTAREALVAYGYVRDDETGVYMHRSPVPTNAWRFVENRGWERYDFAAQALPIQAFDGEEILPYGTPAEDLPGWVKVPYQQNEQFRHVGGLHPATHPECYEWIWPEQVVKEIYAYAATDGGENNWRAMGNGDYVKER